MEEARFIAEIASGPAGRVVAALWGALWGSFFNVLITRVPEGESPVRPASHCRACHAPIGWYDNIPLFSYLILRGRCRRCGARFSARYLLVEALVSALTVAVHQVYVVGATGPIGLRLAQLVIGSLFCGLLVAVAFIDLDTGLIHNVITYPGIPVAAALSVFMGHPHLWDGAVGAAGGYLAIRLLSDGYRLLRGRVGMGGGDAKLVALIGGLLGWQRLVPLLFLAALQGSLIGITALVWIRRRRRQQPACPPEPRPEAADAHADANALANADANAEAHAGADGNADASAEANAETPLRYASLPFGPFLSLAGIEMLLLGDWLGGFVPMFR